MSNKENLKDNYEITLLQIRSFGLYAYFPYLLIYVLQPIFMCMILAAGYGFGQFYVADEIVRETLYLYPPLSIWWHIMIVRQYLEEPGNELFYLYKKVKWDEIFRLYMIYAISLIIPMFVFSFFLGIVQGIYLTACILAISFLYNGFAYWFMYLTKSATIVLIPVLCYTFWVISPYNYQTAKWNYISLFFPDYISGIFWIILMIVFGFIFMLLGKKLNIQYKNY